MKTAIFLARVTFIYNLCMILTLMMRYFNFIVDGSLKSTVIVAGYIMSVVFNGLTVIWCLILVLKGNRINLFQPRWLFVINFLCFIFQLYLLLR